MPERPKRRLRSESCDRLTGLAGRAEGHALLEAALAAARRDSGAPAVAVAMLDLERLRAVNAALGYAVGDRVLQEVARRLASLAGPLDAVARFGSDDFLVVLRRSDRDAAQFAATALCELVSRDLELDGLRLRVRARLGLAIHPEHGRDAATLLRRADLALAEARESHADTVVYRAGEDERQSRRHTIGQSLRDAASLGQLHLEYQPKLELPSRRVAQAEALLRWRHRSSVCSRRTSSFRSPKHRVRCVLSPDSSSTRCCGRCRSGGLAVSSWVWRSTSRRWISRASIFRESSLGCCVGTPSMQDASLWRSPRAP